MLRKYIRMATVVWNSFEIDTLSINITIKLNYSSITVFIWGTQKSKPFNKLASKNIARIKDIFRKDICGNV
jgi:hypothetical protein